MIYSNEILPKLMGRDPSYGYYPTTKFVPTCRINERVARTYFSDLLSHYGDMYRFRSGIKAYPDDASYYLWIDLIRQCIPAWSKGEIPTAIIEHLVMRVAQEKGKEISKLERGDFGHLSFPWHPILEGGALKFRGKGLVCMIYNMFGSYQNFKRAILEPLQERSAQEVMRIREEMSGKGFVEDWASIPFGQLSPTLSIC